MPASLTSATPLRALVLPAVVHSALLSGAFVGDRSLLGDDPAVLAALHLPSTLAWSLTSLVAAVGVATLAMAGRARGPAGAAAAHRAGVALAGGLGVGALVLGCVLGGIAWRGGLLDLDQLRYLVVAAPSVVLGALEGAAVGTLVGRGDTRRPMLAAVAGTALHLATTAVGVRAGAPLLGAAAGVTLGMALQTALVLRWTACGGAADEEIARAQGVLRRLTGPALTERLCYHAGFVGYATLVATLPADEIAANQVLLGLEAIVYPLAEGCAVAASSIVARRGRAASPSPRVATLARGAALAAACFGAAFVVSPQWALGLVTRADAVVAAGAVAAPWAALAQPWMAAALVAVAALRGAGATRAALVVTVVGTAVRLGGTLLALHLGFGLAGAWAATALDWAVQAVFATALWQSSWGAGRDSRVTWLDQPPVGTVSSESAAPASPL